MHLRMRLQPHTHCTCVQQRCACACTCWLHTAVCSTGSAFSRAELKPETVPALKANTCMLERTPPCSPSVPPPCPKVPPPVLLPDAWYMYAGTTLEVPCGGLTDNDFPTTMGGSLVVTALEQPPGFGAQLSFAACGSLTFTPPPDFTGVVNLTYAAHGGVPSAGARSYAIIEVQGNDVVDLKVAIPLESDLDSALRCPDDAQMATIAAALKAEMMKEPGVIDVIIVSINCDWVVSAARTHVWVSVRHQGRGCGPTCPQEVQLHFQHLRLEVSRLFCAPTLRARPSHSPTQNTKKVLLNLEAKVKTATAEYSQQLLAGINSPKTVDEAQPAEGICSSPVLKSEWRPGGQVSPAVCNMAKHSSFGGPAVFGCCGTTSSLAAPLLVLASEIIPPDPAPCPSAPQSQICAAPCSPTTRLAAAVPRSVTAATR